MARAELDVVPGTLDLLVLKALTWGPAHGYNILEWLRRSSDGELRVEDAALYPALHRMEARGWVHSTWGLSENNRRAKFYELTPQGRRQLRAESDGWGRYVTVVARVLATTVQPA